MPACCDEVGDAVGDGEREFLREPFLELSLEEARERDGERERPSRRNGEICGRGGELEPPPKRPLSAALNEGFRDGGASFATMSEKEGRSSAFGSQQLSRRALTSSGVCSGSGGRIMSRATPMAACTGVWWRKGIEYVTISQPRTPKE